MTTSFCWVYSKNMKRCEICGTDNLKNLRMHAAGKALRDASDLEHLLLVVELTPNAKPYLLEKLKEGKHGDEGHRDAMSRVQGKVRD